MRRATAEGVDAISGDLSEGFSLWTHEASEACRFYESRGLVAVERTDGSTTAEKIPDVKYEWRPVDHRAPSER